MLQQKSESSSVRSCVGICCGVSFISKGINFYFTSLFRASIVSSQSVSNCQDNRGVTEVWSVRKQKHSSPGGSLTLKTPHSPASASHISQLKWYHSNRSQYVSKQQHFSSMQEMISEQQTLYTDKCKCLVFPPTVLVSNRKLSHRLKALFGHQGCDFSGVLQIFWPEKVTPVINSDPLKNNSSCSQWRW